MNNLFVYFRNIFFYFKIGCKKICLYGNDLRRKIIVLYFDFNLQTENIFLTIPSTANKTTFEREAAI